MTRTGIVGVVGVMVFSAGVFFFTGTSGVVLPADGASTPDELRSNYSKTSIVGAWECLPLLKGGAQTAECALGLSKDDSNQHYGLDLAAVQDAAFQYSNGAHVRVEGSVVPAEALSSNFWQKYNMTGIVHVTSITKL